jgi:hypothetical protein
MTLAGVRDEMVTGGNVSHQDIDETLTLLADPGFAWWTDKLWLARGRKPERVLDIQVLSRSLGQLHLWGRNTEGARFPFRVKASAQPWSMTKDKGRRRMSRRSDAVLLELLEDR